MLASTIARAHRHANASSFMYRSFRILPRATLLVALLLFARPSVGAAAAIMPLGEIRPGLEVTCKTVLKSPDLVTFRGRVLGRLEGFQLDRTLIIVQFEGETIEHTGIAAGMSGSPVYAGDRLIGALSYSLSTMAKDPVAGVTPIGYMLAEKRRGGGSRPAALPRGLRPLPLPLTVRGASPGLVEEALGTLSPRAGGWPVVALAGGAGGSPSPLVPPLAPGRPVSAVLTRGAVTLAATGTITEVIGDEVYAFGHPFLGTGSVALGMASAAIVTTLADQTYSYKLANVGPLVGAVHTDGSTAIVGRRGDEAPFFPVTVRLDRPDGEPLVYRTEVVAHPELAPILVRIALQASLTQAAGYESASIMDIRATADWGELGLVSSHRVVQTRAGGPGQVESGEAQRLASRFAALWNNPFEPVRPPEITVEVHRFPSRQVQRLVRFRPIEGRPRSGGRMTVEAVVETWRGERRRVLHGVHLPALGAGERVRIWAGSASSLARKGVGLRDKAPRLDQARSVTDIVEALNQDLPDDVLWFVVERRAAKGSAGARRLTGLPRSRVPVETSRPVEPGWTLVHKAPLDLGPLPLVGAASTDLVLEAAL